MAITPEKRLEIETLIFKTFDAVDKTKANSQYYHELFAEMSDAQFEKFLRRRLPFRFHTEIFKNEPQMADIFDGFKVLKKPLIEKVKLPYLYQKEDGKVIESKDCLVLYINIKRLKQMLAKKTNTAIEIAKRDMKTGRLLGEDKGGLESDKEFEGAMALGLENTVIENARIRADAMKAKTQSYNNINVKGEVSWKDIDSEKTDSLAKNTFNVYLIGANIHSNLIDEDYYTPHTLERRNKLLSRDGGDE
ncbi:MAG: hypothetical protein IKA36_00390 [Clostridia bacterium]|nr:hypothetical protein [Clostridia bacterium]